LTIQRLPLGRRRCLAGRGVIGKKSLTRRESADEVLLREWTFSLPSEIS